MPRTRWHTQIWPTPRVARGKARNDKANREQLALKSGGDEEDRTPDLRIANATLSQLSYVPRGAILPRCGLNEYINKRTCSVTNCRGIVCRSPVPTV